MQKEPEAQPERHVNTVLPHFRQQRESLSASHGSAETSAPYIQWDHFMVAVNALVRRRLA
jgi:hypothetical protein